MDFTITPYSWAKPDKGMVTLFQEVMRIDAISARPISPLYLM